MVYENEDGLELMELEFPELTLPRSMASLASEYVPMGILASTGSPSLLRLSDRKKYVIKRLPKAEARTYTRGVLTFSVEAQALYNLRDHEGVINMREHFESEKDYFFILEMPPLGIDMLTFQHKGFRLSEETAKFLIKPLVRTVNEMAESGYWHCDITRSNLVLDIFNLKLKLMNFNAVESSHSKDRSKEPLGTPGYMPPECDAIDRWYAGTKYLTFQIGVTIFAMMFNHLPFPLTVDGTLVHHDPYQFKGHGMSKQLKRLLTGCFKRRPIERMGLQELTSHPWFDKVVSQSRAREEIQKIQDAHERRRERRMARAERRAEAEEEKERRQHNAEDRGQRREQERRCRRTRRFNCN